MKLNKAQKLLRVLGVPWSTAKSGAKLNPSHTKKGPGRRHQQGIYSNSKDFPFSF